MARVLGTHWSTEQSLKYAVFLLQNWYAAVLSVLTWADGAFSYQIVKSILCPLRQLIHIIMVSQICCRTQLHALPDLIPALLAVTPLLQLLPSFPEVT